MTQTCGGPSPPDNQARHWIVDGNNVVGSRPDGWWRDRMAAFGRFAELVAARDWPGADGMTIVFDGARVPSPPERAVTAVEVVVSGRGRSADDLIVQRVAERAGEAVVVTSDRELARRVSDLGALVVSSVRFLGLLEGAV